MPTKKEVILKFSDPTYVPTDAEFGEWKFAREKLGEVNNFTIDKATEIAGETVKQVASELKDGVTSTARLLSEGEYGKMLVSAAEGMVRGTVDLNILGRKIYDTIASFGDDESAAFQRDREIRKMVRARESAKKGETSLLASAASSGSQAREINSMVDPKMGEGASYVLDPFMLTPLGVGGKMGKVAGKAAGGVAKAVGAAARLPEKAVGMVESGIARTAQRFLGDGSEEVTRRARTYADLIGLGGVAASAGLPAAGTVAAARLGVKGLDEAGKGAQAVGRAAAEGPSRFGLFERMSVDPELSQFSRRLAGVASSMGGDTAARAAKAGAVGAVEGASVGAVLGGLADGAEGAIGGAAAGTMLGSLGGVTGLGVDHVTGKGEKRATANDIQRFAATLPEDQARAFKNLPYNAQGDIALAKGVIGDSVSFQVLRPKEFQQQVTEGGASAAHRVLPGTGESVIFIKESPNLSRADVLHEIGHAIYAQTPDIKTSVLQTIQGIYSPDEIRNIEMDYVSRLRSPDAVKRGKAFTDEEKAAMVAEIKGTKGDNYFINEIFAETFADTSIAHSLNRLRKGKLTPVVQEKLLDAKAAVFQKLGIKVKEDGSIDRAALMPWVKSSPRFQKLIAEYTKDLFTFRQNINKRPDPETVKLKFQLTDDELKTPDIGWKWNEERSQYEHPLGTLIPGPGGKEDFRNGTVIRKTQKEIRAEDRARADEVNRVIDRETPRGADDPMLGRRRQIDGKTIISGKVLPEGIYQVSSYNDSQKETMRTVQDSLESNDGTVFQIHYQPIGTSKGQGYKQSVRGTLGSMEMKVREIIPFEFKVTKKDGLNIQALDFTEVKERIKIWKKQGLLDRIYNGNVQAFQKDLSQYLSNLKERVPGETGIGQNKRDFMQAFLGGTKGVNPARGEVPASSRRSLIRSFRVDRTNTLKPAFGKNLVTGEFGPLKYGFDYYRMRDNLSPERERVESDVQQFSEGLEDINIKNSIYYDGENIVVSKFIVPDGERNNGIGTEKMRDLQRLASMHNAKIALTPSKDFGATSIVRLRKFYKQLGFKENKGSNKDWSTKESMIWSPDTFSMDSEYVKAVQSGDESKAQSLVDQKAKSLGAIKAYHGTNRIDRIGNRFDPDRANSGPMPFFTDARPLAESYAKGKQDTSIEIPESYLGWFKYKGQDLSKAYTNAGPAIRSELRKKLPHIIEVSDGVYVYDKDQYGVTGKDHWDYTIKEHGYNPVKAAVDIWLDSGVLFNNEGEFVKILELAGLKGVEFDTPWLSNPGVVNAYLMIKNPLDTSSIPDNVISRLRQEAEGKEPVSKFGVDQWDKRTVSGKEWIDRIDYDLKNGTTHAWTAIPDWVTRTLMDMGYDGIKDLSGKNGGDVFNVYIPFHPSQIKSANPFTYDDAGNLIPLSKRFNADSEDIRFSPERADEKHRQAFESGDYEKAKQLLEVQATKNGYVGPWYHGGKFGSQEETVPWIPSEGMFLARNKSTAESYARNGKLNELYFKQDNVFDPTNPSHLNQEWIQDWINFWREDEGWADRRTGEELSDSEVKDLISRTELYEYESNGSGERWKDFLSTLRDHHDGFIGYDPTDSSWISVVFDPSQLKSADPFTFDGNGNLIPLSKRFNTDSEDIRFSPERDALKSMDPGDASKQMNTSALNFFYNNKNSALAKPQVETSNSEAASLLQDEAVKFWGEVVTSKDIEPWQKDILVETVVDEVKAALKADGKNAANWYTTDITAAIDIAKKLFSELENDAAAQATPAGFKNKEDAALGLFVATAITSQNLKVSQNTRYAVEQFETLIKTGKFDSERSYGSKAKSINENLSLANKMVENLGWSGLKDFVSEEFTIKELQNTMLDDHGLKVSIDGNVSDIVNGASIFGPKIGQGFLQNLLGSFNPVTIDLWMRRTWGRWTGDVVNKKIKQEQIAGLISEMRKGRRRIPDALKKIKVKTDFRPSTGKEFITIPDRQYDAIQNSPEMVDAVLKISTEIDREWQQVYKTLNRGISPEDTARLLAGDVTPYKMAEKYNKIREKLKEKHKKLKASDPGIDPFSKWVDKVGMPSMGYTDKYEQWGKGTNVKPQFVKKAKVIVETQKPIDAPSNADRKVITEVINNARGKLEDEGYTTTNADIQAILWYPEKDIWDQVTGRKPNKLKSSYNDEFRKIAEQRGISYSPHREPARSGWGSGSGQTGRFPDQINEKETSGKSFSPERYFSLRSGHRIIHPPGRKVRLYAPSGALVGVYESEEQAMRRASR